MSNLDLLKQSLSLDGDGEDAALSAMLSVAQDYIAQYTGIPVPAKDCEDTILGPWRQAWLHAYPVRNVESIVMDGEDVAEHCRVRTESGSMEWLGHAHAKSTIIRYNAGMMPGETPDALGLACVLLAAALYKAGAHGGRVVTGERLGDYQVSFAAQSGSGSMTALCPTAAALLAPYVRATV